MWNHFTVVPASFDRLRSRNPEPAPAEAGGERRAVALGPRLRGGDDRVRSTCSETALVGDDGPGELSGELLCIAAGIELDENHGFVAAAR